jgi:hypothetical protein
MPMLVLLVIHAGVGAPLPALQRRFRTVAIVMFGLVATAFTIGVLV